MNAPVREQIDPLPAAPAESAVESTADSAALQPAQGKTALPSSLKQQTKHGGRNIFRNVPFLLLFSFTIMNAFLYVYLAANDFPAIDQETADATIREAFGKNYAYFSPVSQFLFEVRTAGEPGFPEFRRSLAKLNEGINSLGIHTGDLFARRSFRFTSGGIYWAPPAIEGKTTYKPVLKVLGKN